MIKYKDIYDNWNNPEWTGWKEVFEVETTIPKPRCNRYKEPKAHIGLLVNAWIVEESVRRMFDNVDYYEAGHDVLKEGPGNNNPDFKVFIDGKILTAELKRYDRLSLSKANFHGADIYLWIDRETEILRKMNLHNDSNYKVIEKVEYIYKLLEV